jgi:hypothetical protein
MASASEKNPLHHTQRILPIVVMDSGIARFTPAPE